MYDSKADVFSRRQDTVKGRVFINVTLNDIIKTYVNHLLKFIEIKSYGFRAYKQKTFGL